MTNEIEVRIYDHRFGQIGEAIPLDSLSEVLEAVEGTSGFVRVFVAGEEWSLCDLCCTAEECGRDLDSQPGWSHSGEHADFEMRCPTHAAAERKVA